jgi:hypothetical protein
MRVSLKARGAGDAGCCEAMHIRMSNLERLTVAEMEEFVSSNRGIDCSVIEGAAAYGFIERVLTAQLWFSEIVSRRESPTGYSRKRLAEPFDADRDEHRHGSAVWRCRSG